MNNAQFGRFIAARRQEIGMTQTELARRAGMSRPYLARIETGHNTPSVRVLWRLAQTLALDVFALHALVGRLPNACVPASYERALAAGESHFRTTVDYLLAWRKATHCAPRCPDAALHGSSEAQDARKER